VVVAAALKNLDATVEKLSEAAGIPAAKINAVIKKGAPITPELSVRLGKALGEKDRYFADLQLTADIAAAAKEVGKIAKLRKPAGRPGRKSVEKKADVPAGKPGRKPGRKPAESPGAAQPPEKAPDQTPEQTPDQAPDQTLPKKRGRKPGFKVAK
jgi:addiction module HigA family antidote